MCVSSAACYSVVDRAEPAVEQKESRYVLCPALAGSNAVSQTTEKSSNDLIQQSEEVFLSECSMFIGL